MGAQTTPAASGGMESNTPDMDAGERHLPPVSCYLTDDEFIVFLASQKLRNGKYRMSANDIVKATHGDRNQVLKLVREVREGVPEFRPLTPEQQATRDVLALDN
jgi:hypothetical protein